MNCISDLKLDLQLVDQKCSKSALHLLPDILRLRRDVFISNLGWNLYENLGCEFDQYDGPAAVHVAALVSETVVGCMRIMPTAYSNDHYTYMILDAHRGRIPNLPSNILNEEIACPKIFEGSRLAISNTVFPQNRNKVLLNLMAGASEYIKQNGGSAMIGLMNPVFQRVYARNGISVRKVGPICEQRDGRIVVLKLDF